jgi:hypothetical protein
MTEEDYKLIIAKYQQKSFELFNANIVLETQLNSCQNTIEILGVEIERLKKLSMSENVEGEFG